MSELTTKRDHCDVAIIGGGVAGSLAAIHLARAGFHVVVFEKNLAFNERVSGEFLSYESLPLLREIGIDPLFLGGVDLTQFRLHGPTASAEVRLPRRAVGVTRTALVKEMLRIAAESGAVIRRGVCVGEILEGLDETTGSILLSTSAGETRCQRLIVATGKTEFGSLNERVGRDSSLNAFKMHVRLKPSIASALGSSCDLFAFEGGYGSLTSVGNGLANFAFVLDRKLVERIGTSWDALAAHIGKSNWKASHSLDGAEHLSQEFATSFAVPYGFLRRAPAPAGVFFLGDQMAVFPSLAGEGMTIALMTARRAVDAIIERGVQTRLRFAIEASREYQRSVRASLRPQLESALTLHKLFKTPRLVDVTTYALRVVPAIFTRAFRSTRCQLIPTSPKSRLAPQSQKPAVAGSI